MLKGFWVPVMEFRYELLKPLGIFCWSPNILFNPISLPAYQVFKFPLEHLAIQNTFDFILLNSIMDYQWGWCNMCFMMWCTALLNGNWNTDLWRGSDIGFSLYTVPTYYNVSEYFKWNTESGIWKLIWIGE